MKKRFILVKILMCLCIVIIIVLNKKEISNETTNDNTSGEVIIGEKRIEPQPYNMDYNKNGIDDVIDMLNSGKREVENKVTYKSTYYDGGYPPENEGVCTDVIWRSLKDAGIDLKSEMDKDIKNNVLAYKAGVNKPDPNIDFRRVKNQQVYFERFYIKLTTEVNPEDKDSLKQWQPGDIVVKSNNEHVAMISDKIEENGVPYVLHNYYNHATEDNYLYDWYKKGYIVAHYRLNTELYK